MNSPTLLRLFGAHEAAKKNERLEHDRVHGREMMNMDAFADIQGESPPQRLSPKMKFAKGAHEKGREEGDVFGGKRRSKSHRKSHRKACHRKSHRKASHRKASHRRH
jgi:hypothetical protein